MVQIGGVEDLLTITQYKFPDPLYKSEQIHVKVNVPF